MKYKTWRNALVMDCLRTLTASKKDTSSIMLGASEKYLHRHLCSYAFNHFGVLKCETIGISGFVIYTPLRENINFLAYSDAVIDV